MSAADRYRFCFPDADDAEVAPHGLADALAGLEPAPQVSAATDGIRVAVSLDWPAEASDEERRVAERLLADWAGSSGGRLA